jgi:hypothetical protein
MSTLLVAAIPIGFIAISILLFIQSENRKNRKHMNQFLTRFTELGSLNNLTFSSQEILQDVAIGLDGVHRKLLILRGSNKSTASAQLLHLSELKSCSVKKQYGPIHAVDLKKNKLEQYLQKLSLCFERKDNKEPVEIDFFHHNTSSAYSPEKLEKKAKNWEAIFSKILKYPTKEAAL